MLTLMPSTVAQAPDKPFSFYSRATVFDDLSKADAKRQMRVGGPMGSDGWDLAKEQVLQENLNYDDLFGLRGFFNKNHSQDMADILGYPEFVKLYSAGETMPNGDIAKHNTTWVEGYLYDTQKGRETFELAKAMQGSGRSLGFSVEGHVEQRTGPGNKVIAKARIKNVAITHIPCNPDARLEVLYRSLAVGEAPTLQEVAVGVPVGTDPPAPPTDGLKLAPEELDRRIALVVQRIVNGALAKTASRRPMRPARTVVPASLARSSPPTFTLLKSIYSTFPDASPAYAVALAKRAARIGQARSR